MKEALTVTHGPFVMNLTRIGRQRWCLDQIDLQLENEDPELEEMCASIEDMELSSLDELWAEIIRPLASSHAVRAHR